MDGSGAASAELSMPRTVDGAVPAKLNNAPEQEEEESKKEKQEEAVPWLKLLSGAETLDKALMAVGVVGALGSGLSWPIFAILFAQFSNAFGDPSSDDFMDTIISIALKFVYLGIGSMVGMFLQSSMWMWAGHRQTSRLRSRYLAAVLRQDMSFFDTTATTGGLLQGLNEHSNDVQAAISEKVGHFLQHMTTFVAGIIVAFTAGWDMTLVMIGTLPFLAAVGAILAKITTVMGSKSTEAYSAASSLLQQSLAQIRTVAAFGGEQRALDAYNQALEQPTRLGVLSGIYSGLALGAVNTIVYCTYAVAFAFGSWRVSQGKYDGGQVMQVMLAVLLGGFSLGQAAPVFETFNKGCVAGAQIFRVIDRVPPIDPESDEGQTLPDEELQGSLELRDVVFSYPVRPDVRVFHGFSLAMPGGQTTALVGSSGSGKSSAVALLQRFYDPEQGVVLVDGVDIRRLNLKWLRGHIGLVSQEPTLFATSIGENIAMGRPGATQEEIQRAAELANAAHFISQLPAGYTTHVGERGLQLSGGQKQRIAIARAILKNPKILLLDEATSALDTRSEQVVQAALDNMIVGRTTVVVAHRLSTIRNADHIAVVQSGRVVELGTHRELISRPDGAYTTLVKLQMQEEAQRKEKEAGEDEDEEEEEGVVEDFDEPSEASLSRALATGAAPAAAHLDSGGLGSASQVQIGHQPASTSSGPLGGLDRAAASTISVDSAGKADKDRGAPDLLAVAAAKEPLDAASGASAPVAKLEMVVVGGGDKATRRKHHHKKGAAGGRGKSAKEVDGDEKERKDKKSEEEEEVDVPFSRLVLLSKPEWPWTVPGVVGSAVLGALQPIFALLLSAFIILFYESDKAYIKRRGSFFAWMFFVLGVANLLASLMQLGAFGKMGSELARRVRVLAFSNLLHQEIAWFDQDGNSSGALSSKLATDASYIRGAVGDTVGMFCQNIVTLAAGYAISFVYDWRMALVVTGALPFILSGSVLFYVAATSADAGNSKLFASANQAVSDAFSSIRVVQSYRLQSHMTDLYGRLTHEADVKGQRKAFIMGAILGYGQLSIFGVYSLVTWFGGDEVDSGRTDFEHFLTSYFAILFACFGIAQAQVGFPDVGKAKDAVRSVFPILDRKSKIDASDPSGQVLEHMVQGAVELRDVTFAYPSRASVMVFKSFSLDIPAGKQVALVGESGSGKSTVVGLILRFYDVLAGQVLVDGVDVRQYNLRSLRSHVGLVSQEPLLFSTTVLANITFGRPDASMEEVEAAARVANAYDFIMALPEGFHTQIGEKGVQLSGGMKQRVAIARAVLKDPRILLLDEATSALDAASERVVQEALDHVMVGRTSVVVAHRLSTIRNADKIALVQRGHILEQGTHAELMAAEGGYARLVAAQNQNKEGGGAQAGVGATPSKRAKGGGATTVVPAVADSPRGAGEEL